MIIPDLLAMFVVDVGHSVLSVAPADAAEMMEADKTMVEAAGNKPRMALRCEGALIKAAQDKLTPNLGIMARRKERVASNYCQNVPESNMRAGLAPGLYKSNEH